MAPKLEKKREIVINRPVISTNSLVHVPIDVVEGYQERIETGVDWVLAEKARQHHKAQCLKENILKVTFSKALDNKIKNSILGRFLDEHSSLTLQDHWEVTLPMTIFDNEKCANEEGKICFRSANCLSNNLMAIIQQAVKANNRNLLKNEFKKFRILRLVDAKITHLDNGLAQFPQLLTLNLCGNYITALDTSMLPKELRILELRANGISNMDILFNLPDYLLYLGLARNLLTNDSDLKLLSQLPQQIVVVDLSDNDIYDLEQVINPLSTIRTLQSLILSGNPCAMCMGYARFVISKILNLRYLDNRQIMNTDRPEEPYEHHPDDLRSTYFFFSVIRIMSPPCPPRVDKGAIATFHVELELPLLDSDRRMFLMFRRNESLTELLPAPEDDIFSYHDDKNLMEHESASEETTGDIFAHLETKNSREIRHYTTFESNKIPWSKIMNFQEPIVKIFCPDLVGVRNTFRSVITVRFVYTMLTSAKAGKPEKKIDKKDKGPMLKLRPTEQRVVIASIKCALRPCDWSQQAQHFHWDDTLFTDEAIHWGEGDLSAIQYYTQGASNKPQKSKPDNKGKPDVDTSTKHVVPENFTCHFSFGVEFLRTT